MTEFSMAAMDRLIRRAGGERVSQDASLELATVIESYGEEIAKEAIRRTKQEGVKTVKQKHIRKAVKDIEKTI